ncbi:MAG: hypothetical protein EOO63_08015 [Hymenobacter sp.]|nr:MAG: hypothetical protein EOO63_08015 [Hymenobacter sp.]
MQKRSKKPVLLALWVAIVAKYLLLYLILMGKNHDYYFLAPGIGNASDFGYYLWLLLALPTFEFCLLPLYWALTSATTTLAAATTLACVALAALLYYQVASPSDATNGVIQGLLGLGVQGLLWLKIKQLTKSASVL